MKLTSDSETLAEKKALILYILNKVSKPISNDALLKLVITIDNMNYFYFQQFLLDLLENKYIISFEQDGENLYELTDAGRQALELVSDIIPGIAKFRVDNSFKETLGDFQNKASITSDFIPHNENEYSVKCKIVENNQTLFEVQVYAGTREQAKKIANTCSRIIEYIDAELNKSMNNQNTEGNNTSQQNDGQNNNSNNNQNTNESVNIPILRNAVLFEADNDNNNNNGASNNSGGNLGSVEQKIAMLTGDVKKFETTILTVMEKRFMTISLISHDLINGQTKINRNANNNDNNNSNNNDQQNDNQQNNNNDNNQQQNNDNNNQQNNNNNNNSNNNQQ